MHHLKRFWIISAVLLVCLSACATAPLPVPSVTATLVPPATETPRPTATPAPTSTPVPPDTATATLTNTLPPTATATAGMTSTPRPSFAGFQVDYTQLVGSSMAMGFHIPGIKENYRLKVDGVEYTCSLNTRATDRLYCTGTPVKAGQTVTLVFLPLQGGDSPIFETSYKVLAYITPTWDAESIATFVATAGSCAVRGLHVTCETEYRRNGDTFCIVATCADQCGYYYSVDTCPIGSEHNGIFPMTGTPPLPPIR
jgi:hypothetical protein